MRRAPASELFRLGAPDPWNSSCKQVFINQTEGPLGRKCHLVAPDLPGSAKPRSKLVRARSLLVRRVAEKLPGGYRMGFYDGWLFPRMLDLVMQQKQMVPSRERIGKAASGRVLDIGIGSGLNLPFYGEQADHVCGVDPSAELLQFAEEPAQKAQFRLSFCAAREKHCHWTTKA
jgi:2-polyprenyl-3-methyl-5-hydroxy-6-metoxy-1,4-benzoquinol methylase